MSWGLVRGHKRVLDEMRSAAGQGRFPHALLFVGPEGIGKRTFARRLARALLCENASDAALDPCEACVSCRMVAAETHPDLIQTGRPADKHELPIAVVRELTATLALKPMRGGRRVAIVDDADHMNEEAANAFLKTLEEPPPGSVLIMIGTSAELQLDTVLSRCRVVRFDPLSEAELTAVLIEGGVTDDADTAARLARLGEGSVKRALGLADAEIGPFRRALIDELTRETGFDAPALAQRFEAFAKDAGKESVLQRERASLLVGELARFFRGVLWQTAGLEPPASDPADRRAAEVLGERLEPEDVFLLADRCMTADYQIQRRANLSLVLLALMNDLRRVLAA